MILSVNDIKKIQNLGYDKKFFVRKDYGYFKLKNKDGRCVFHNGEKCLIYDFRPEGCKLYPLIFNDKYHCAVIDNECPYKHLFSFKSKDIEKLKNLINIL